MNKARLALGRLSGYLRARGREAESILGDWILNVCTGGRFAIGGGKHVDAHEYDTCAHCAVVNLIRLLGLCESDVCVDIGCGKGRVVCHLARRRVRKVLGIDISEELCKVARRNAASLRGKLSPIEIVHADAAVADLTEGTVFFLFNPFGPSTLRDVLRNIESTHSLDRSPVRIAYVNALHADVFDEFAWLEWVQQYRRGNGWLVGIWRNKLFPWPGGEGPEGRLNVGGRDGHPVPAG